MQSATQKLHALLLPLNGVYLVLPQPTIAEIVPRPQIAAARGGPDWLLGHFSWRAERVPLISFERMSGQADEVPFGKHACAAVLYTLSDAARLTYYALALQAVPRRALLAPADLLPGLTHKPDNALIAADVTIGGRRAVIPALEGIEQLINARALTKVSPQ